MERRITIRAFEVSIVVAAGDDPGRHGYIVRYSISRSDGRPVRGELLTVQSYDLIDGTDYFSSVDAALDYGEKKARNDVATF